MKTKLEGRIVIDSRLCKGCKYCITACPVGAIDMEAKFNNMGHFPARLAHPGKCTGCAICAQMCPEIAIDVLRQAKRS